MRFYFWKGDASPLVVQWNREASMRSHAGLFPLYSDRDTQGLTLRIILCRFPDAIKKCLEKKKLSAGVQNCSLFQQARCDVCVCRSVTRRSLMSYLGCSQGPKREWENGNNCPLIILSGRRMAEHADTQAEGSVHVKPQLLEILWCYDTSALQLSIFDYCVCGLVWGAGISSSVLHIKQSSE